MADLSFDNIPADSRANIFGAELTHDKVNPSVYLQEQSILLIGNQLAAGTLVADTPTGVDTLEDVQRLAGRGSELSLMAAAALRNAPTAAISVAAVTPVGTAGTGTITLSSAPTAGGTLAVYINGTRVAVVVAAADTISAIATRVADAVNANADLPVSAAANAAVVTLTAKWKGTTSNGIAVKVSEQSGDQTPAGLGVAVVATAGGTVTPDVAPTVNAIVDADNFTVIAHPFTDDVNLTALEGLQATRWSPQLNKPVVIIGADAAANPPARDSFISCIVATQGIAKFVGEIAAAVAGRVADGWGGDPSQQLRGREVVGLPAPPRASQLSWAGRNTLLGNGISTLIFVGSKVQIGQLRNTLQTLPDSGAVAPESDRYLNSTLTVGAVMFDLAQYFKVNWDDAKLGNDGEPQPLDQKVMTVNTFKGLVIDRYTDVFAARGWVENAAGFAASLIVRRNADNRNRLDAKIQIYVIGNFRILAIKIGFDFA